MLISRGCAAWRVLRMPQTKFTLQCSVCKMQNYLTTKNRQNVSEKLTLKKHCRKCNAHTEHAETRLRK
jgi:large subunit ribosomal protein L33